MARGTATHSRLCRNLIVSLENALRGTDCDWFTSDLRLAVSPKGLYTYPDAIVVCGQPRFLAPDIITNPVVIFEVLSPTTAEYDRGKRFRQYRSIDTFREYVLVAQDACLVEKYERQTDGRWLWSESNGLDASFTLNSVPCTLALRDIYERVELAEEL